MDYTILDPLGEIRCELTAADPTFDDNGQKVYPDIVTLNVPDGCTFIEGAPPSDSCYWGGEWIEKPARPQPWDTWDPTTKTWIDARALDQVKAEQWEAVKAGRDATIFSTLTWDGSVFQVDDDSQQRIQGAVQLARLAQSAGQNDWAISWTLADNSVRQLSITDMVNLGLALGTFVQSNWNKATSLRDQINAAQTAAEVEAIAWSPA